MSANLFTSNRFEVLAEVLYQSLYSSFGRKIVLVPSDQIKRFLQSYFLERADIAFGMQFLRIDEGLNYLLHLLGEMPRFPSAGQLFLDILATLDSRPYDYPELESYLERDKGMRDLADQLSRLFLRYGKEGSEALTRWRNGSDWQSRLFNQIFNSWDNPSSFFERWHLPQKAPIPLEVHLFGLCPLKPLQLAYCERLAKIWPFYFYSLAPSSHYLGDLLSEKEMLKKRMHADGHQILLNFGQYSGKIQKTLLDLGLEPQDLFIKHSPRTQLEWLQSEILECRPATLCEKDDSIQLHLAPSKVREIEVLKMVVLNLLNEEPDLKPRDFLIMAPDIASYLPHIQLVFSQSELPFEVSDLPIIEQNTGLKALSHFLDLVSGPFEREQVVDFFSFDPVKKRRQLTHHREMNEWLQKSAVRFGMTAHDRREYLNRYSKMDVAQDEVQGTFAHGLFHLMMGLVTIPEDESPYFASEILEFSQAELLGSWMASVERLYYFVSKMQKERVSAQAWGQLFVQFCQEFIDGGEELIQPLIAELRFLPTRCIDYKFSFESIKMVLKRSLSRSIGRLGESDYNRLRFCSMKAGRATPAKVVYLLGMEKFPQHETPLSIDSFKSSTITMSEEDRMLFLELLISARRHFILSYTSLSPEDGKREPPSLFIDELKRALHGELTTYEHPGYRFHPDYFSKTSRWKNFSAEDFAAQGRRPYRKKSLVQLPDITQKRIILKSLENLAKNPFKFFINESMGIYFPFEEDYDATEFTLSGKEAARLKRLALEGKLSLERESLFGHLPVGAFKEVVWRDLQEQIELEKASSITFKSDCNEAHSPRSGVLILPPLIVGEYEIVGSLPPINSRGLLTKGKKSLEERWKMWPLFLVYLQLPLQTLGMRPNLVYLDGEEEFSGDAKEALSGYIAYYLAALKMPAPLHPLLLRDFFKGPEKFAKKLSTLEDETYLTWLEGAHFGLRDKSYFDSWNENAALASFHSLIV